MPHTARWRWMSKRERAGMGERGKAEDMTNRRTTLEAVAPESAKPNPDDPQTRDPMGRPVNTHQKPEVRLGREAQARIGQQLRALYDDVVSQGVPDHITDLVRRLSEQE
jgi:hypothetical protein